MSKVHEAIAAVAAEIPAIGKDKRNQQQGFNYRGIDDVYNVMSPLMAKNGLVMIPQVLDQKREERQTNKGGTLAFVTLKIKYRFFCDDGSALEDEFCPVVVGEGMDSGDKATNKAMSIAHKYAMFQMFCIATEELYDPDADSHTILPKASKPNQAPPPKSPTEEPYDLARIRNKFSSLSTVDEATRYLKSLAVPANHSQKVAIGMIYKETTKAIGTEPPATTPEIDPATADFMAQEAAREGQVHA